jgi:hypothetical protein
MVRFRHAVISSDRRSMTWIHDSCEDGGPENDVHIEILAKKMVDERISVDDDVRYVNFFVVYC